MSTPNIPPGTSAVACGSGKKLRFDIDDAQPRLRSAIKSGTCSVASSKGSSPAAGIMGSTDDMSGEGDGASTGYTFSGGHPQSSFANSGVRRSSESGDVLRVSVNPEPSSVIDTAHSPSSPSAHTVLCAALKRAEHSEVAQTLADLASGTAAAAGAGAESDPLVTFRPLLLRLVGLLLTRRPSDPERFLVDYFASRNLGAHGTGLGAAAASSPLAVSLLSGGMGGSVAGSDTDPAPVPSNATSSNCVGTEGGESVTGRGGGRGAVSQLLSFAPVGDTVAQRLAFSAPVGVGRAIVERMAKLLLDVKPEDPEMFLWTKLDSRSFTEEAAAASTVVYTSDGLPILPPEDPTQAALLRLVPASSPGYSVAANLIPVLFAKKPYDPTNYLFLYLTSRARSNMADSVRSSMNYGAGSGRPHAPLHPPPQARGTAGNGAGEEDNTSYTSRELADYGDDDDVDNDEYGSVFKDELSPEQDAVVTNFLSHLQRKGVAPPGGPQRRSRRGSATNSSAGRAQGQRPLPLPSGPPASASPQGVGRRGVGGATGGGHAESSQSFGSAGKRVCIAEDPVVSTAPPMVHRPSFTSYGSQNISVAATAGQSFAGHVSSVASFSPSFRASPPRSGGGGGDAGVEWAAQAAAAEGLRQELVAMSVRDALRLERVQYEVGVLRHEASYLARLSAIDRGGHARAAAAAASEALVAAEVHLRLLEARRHHLESELIPRQLAAFHGTLPSPLGGASRGDSFFSSAAAPAPYTGGADGAWGASADVAVELSMLRQRVEQLVTEQARMRAQSSEAAQ